MYVCIIARYISVHLIIIIIIIIICLEWPRPDRLFSFSCAFNCDFACFYLRFLSFLSG